ncbi:MAG: hypothetical protein L0G94_17705 [Brachybacterium sp.]|uniref:hypothetical protein n=1 Tax=Brachybacterium sp. TaxID=1891286 RepID=UPI00264882F5|nr:hypothetical protein [Brachybacterium sp.]MDN5688493.1 hypothetical protein [Brachybacterium sp.]
MDTAHDRQISRTERLPAQLLAVAALVCAAIAFFWDAGLASFLLASIGLALAVTAVAVTPDGWLVADDEGAL